MPIHCNFQINGALKKSSANLESFQQNHNQTQKPTFWGRSGNAQNVSRGHMSMVLSWPSISFAHWKWIHGFIIDHPCHWQSIAKRNLELISDIINATKSQKTPKHWWFLKEMIQKKKSFQFLWISRRLMTFFLYTNSAMIVQLDDIRFISKHKFNSIH